MATAPTEREAEAVRVDADEEPEADARFQISMTFPDGERKSRVLDLMELGPADDAVSRQATGLPVQAFIGLDSMGSDGTLLLWLLAGRQEGAKGESFQKLVDTFPTYRALGAADFDVEVLDPLD